jgi:hypothetical protein
LGAEDRALAARCRNRSARDFSNAPPRPLDHSAPPGDFSAARAKLHVDQIAREPHPIGTDANRRVRDYLIEQLTALGAEVRVQSTVGIVNTGRSIRAGTAENIVATLRGTANRRALMLASHYDSVPMSPGASDAGAGVGAILEVFRALKHVAPLKNDLIVVYTDGEEEGLVGAAGFVRDHPDLARWVGVVLNLEARGSSGPALMFETSDGNGWLAREFARAAPHPMASSVAYAVYKELPNDTDMTVFKRAGFMGLNSAFSATFENYHTPRDSPENLSLASVQHLGANALALARHFGNSEAEPTRQPDRIYFNWLGSRIIHCPPWSPAWSRRCGRIVDRALRSRTANRTSHLRARGWRLGWLHPAFACECRRRAADVVARSDLNRKPPALRRHTEQHALRAR